MLSLFLVLPVVAQPTINANRAMTLIMLNEFRICFMFFSSWRFAAALEMISSVERIFRQQLLQFCGALYIRP